MSCKFQLVEKLRIFFIATFFKESRNLKSVRGVVQRSTNLCKTTEGG